MGYGFTPLVRPRPGPLPWGEGVKIRNAMLFPIADDNRGRTITPIVNYVLIAVNILVFVFLQGLGSDDKFTYAYSTVPGEIITGKDIVTRPVVVQSFTGQRMEMPGLQPTVIPVYLTLITSMFM